MANQKNLLTKFLLVQHINSESVQNKPANCWAKRCVNLNRLVSRFQQNNFVEQTVYFIQVLRYQLKRWQHLLRIVIMELNWSPKITLAGIF